MPRLKHGFCSLHRIAYRREFDATCPQCVLSGVQADQLDYDPEATQTITVAAGAPVDASGKAIDLDSL